MQSKKENNETTNNLIDNNFTEFYENGDYYVGQSLNGKKHGKGVILDINGNTIYEGDFANDEKEGNGKMIYKEGYYYIGQWLKGKKHGKGKNIIKMVIFYMKVILSMIKEMETENIFLKMENII